MNSAQRNVICLAALITSLSFLWLAYTAHNLLDPHWSGQRATIPVAHSGDITADVTNRHF